MILISEYSMPSRGWHRDFLRAWGHHHGRGNSGQSLVEGFQQRWPPRSLPFQLCRDHLRTSVFFQRQLFVSLDSVPALRDQKLWGIQQRELKTGSKSSGCTTVKVLRDQWDKRDNKMIWEQCLSNSLVYGEVRQVAWSYSEPSTGYCFCLFL